MATDDTYLYVAKVNGEIRKVTIADLTDAFFCRLPGKIVAMRSDATYLWCGLSNGDLYRVTIANATVLKMDAFRYPAAFATIVNVSTTLYYVRNNGKLYSRT
jgi:hypothetical protein